MPREKPTYRLHLEELRKRYPDREVLSRAEIMAYTGRGRRWLESRGFIGSGFTVVDVALFMAELDEQRELQRRKQQSKSRRIRTA